MAYNQNNNFWDFVRSLDGNNNNNGDGVDRPSQPPGAWPFGGLTSHPPPPPPPPPADPEHGGHPHHPSGPPPYGPGPHPHHHHPPPHPPFWGMPFAPGFTGHPRCFRGGPGPRGGRHGRCGRRDRRGGDEEGEQHHGGPFDFAGFLNGLASHPIAQQYRQYFEQMAGQHSGEANRDGNDDEESFTPPIDIFTTETHFVLHVALPGAKKEDVGINWDNEKGVLNVAGVIYRPGDEEFLKTLTQSERRVGVFERAIKLPPPGHSDEKDEVDGDAITAKLEDGVLLVRVPKVEKEWTDVKKVDIE